MIKIEKDLTRIPPSLVPAIDAYFPPPNTPPSHCKTTHVRRLQVIANRAYIWEPKYDARYRYPDIKAALKEIYNGKCAFCEQRVEFFHIEHYRPKDIYYWLAYSWDNLLLACPICNSNKNKNFEIEGTRANFEGTPQCIERINISSADIDVLERPRLVNPEVTDPSGNIVFEKDGRILSNERRFSYTIDTCKIDRSDLNDDRRAILNSFKDDIRSALVDNPTKEMQTTAIGTIVTKFVKDSKDRRNPYLAFRRHLIDNWLADLIKDQN